MFASGHRAGVVIAALALGAPLMAGGPAAAQVRYDTRSYGWQGYQPQGQYDSYEAYVPPSYTCTDQRYASQVCWTDEDGEQRCQTTGGQSAETCR